jgi:hypothetical protein
MIQYGQAVSCLLLVEEDCDKISAHLEAVLDTVIQIHEVIKGGSVTSESTLSIRKEISVLQNPDISTTYSKLRGLK